MFYPLQKSCRKNPGEPGLVALLEVLRFLLGRHRATDVDVIACWEGSANAQGALGQ
jgi:hypothetical protein